MLEAIANLFAQVALKTAISASGAASAWLGYQPKEPEELQNLKK